MSERRGAAAEALSRLSEWADAHLGLLRSLSAGMAVAGLLVLARSARLATKFTSALDIPVEFVEKNVKLRGRVHHVTEKGLEVEHIPISIPFLTSIQRRWAISQHVRERRAAETRARQSSTDRRAPPPFPLLLETSQKTASSRAKGLEEK